MKKIFILLGALLAMLALSQAALAQRGVPVASTRSSPGPAKGNNWLFVIGINAYRHWPRLRTAVNDAKALKAELLSRYRFDQKRLVELYDLQATRKNIIARLRQLARVVGRDDSLLIYYAGHGYLDPLTKTGSWIPVEAGVREASAWLGNQEIKNYLRADVIKARHILLISDSCFAGDFFRSHRGPPGPVDSRAVSKAFALTSRQAITSGGLEPVSDQGFQGHSVFSYFLLKALAENQRPYLLPWEFFGQIKAGVADNSDQLPVLGSLYGTGGQAGGEMVLFLESPPAPKEQAAAQGSPPRASVRPTAGGKALPLAGAREKDEIADGERKLAALDAEIALARRKAQVQKAQGAGELDSLLELVRRREAENRKLLDLKRELFRLKIRDRKKKLAALKQDLAKYREIAGSPLGRDMAARAWHSLAARYPDWSKSVEPGDEKGLLKRAEDQAWSRDELADLLALAPNRKEAIALLEKLYPADLEEKLLGSFFPGRGKGSTAQGAFARWKQGPAGRRALEDIRTKIMRGRSVLYTHSGKAYLGYQVGFRLMGRACLVPKDLTQLKKLNRTEQYAKSLLSAEKDLLKSYAALRPKVGQKASPPRSGAGGDESP